MNKIISKIIQIILFIIGTPFYLIDLFYKNKYCELAINRINIWCYELNWWGKK